jgi:uncharacterized protein YdhG (YjbR/CyaY superfamily)
MTVIDECLMGVPEPQKRELERVRRIILEEILDAEEVIGYGMPSFKVNGTYVAHFAAFKDHLSLFPTGIVDDFKDRLAGFKTSKGTIQFSTEHPLPEELIRELVRVSLARHAGKS